jgi:glutaredoxin 3
VRAPGGAPPPPLPAALSGLLSSHPVVVFTRSYCSFCKDLVERLDDAGVAVHEVPLEGDGARDSLRAHTGQRSVPFVFFKGELIDADSLLGALRAPGDKVLALLQRHSIPRGKGYFRP